MRLSKLLAILNFLEGLNNETKDQESTLENFLGKVSCILLSTNILSHLTSHVRITFMKIRVRQHLITPTFVYHSETLSTEMAKILVHHSLVGATDNWFDNTWVLSWNT